MTGAREVLRFHGTLADFASAAEALRRLLDARELPATTRHNVELAFEEIAVNIVRHGRTAGEIEVTVLFEEATVMLTFEDDGVPFDPSGRPEPNLPESLDDATPGGLGLALVRRFVSRLEYERTPRHRNRLTLTIPTR